MMYQTSVQEKAFVHVSENEYLKRQAHFTFKNQN